MKCMITPSALTIESNAFNSLVIDNEDDARELVHAITQWTMLHQEDTPDEAG